MKPAVANAVQTTDISRTNDSNIYADMGALTVAIAVNAGSLLYIDFNCAFAITSGGASAGFRILVDGNPLARAEQRQTGWGPDLPEGASILALTAALIAGNHTVKVQWTSGPTTITCNAGTASTRYAARLNVSEVLQ